MIFIFDIMASDVGWLICIRIHLSFIILLSDIFGGDKTTSSDAILLRESPGVVTQLHGDLSLVLFGSLFRAPAYSNS
jgi:hypothetical protein